MTALDIVFWVAGFLGNVTLFVGILQSLKQAGMKKDAIIFVVSNPVDILTQLAAEQTGLPASQVLGLGTVLDTSRLCSLIASALKLRGIYA